MALVDQLTPLEFAHELEAGEQWPQTANNDAVLTAWMEAEGLSSFSYRNPLNTTQREPGASYGAGSVAHYPDWQTALKGTMDALASGGGQWYAAIRNDLASNAPAGQTAHDIEASPWAGGHYGAVPPAYTGGNIERILGDPNFTPSGLSAPGAGTTAQLTGIDLNPLNWWGDITSGVQKDVAKIVVTGAFLAGGITLVVLGAWRSVSPSARARIVDTGKTAATAAALA